MRDTSPQKTIFDAIGIKTAAFTAATTDIITSAAHGLKNGDMVVLTTTDTLPDGLALATVYLVHQATTDTFELINKDTGASVAITDTGTGTHTFTMHDVGNAINVEYYKNNELALDSDGGDDAAMVVKFQASYQKEAPDFSASQAEDNQWFYIAVRDRNSNSVIDGDTGITFSGADDHRAFNIESNSIVWISAIISSWTAGEITLKAKSSNDG